MGETYLTYYYGLKGLCPSPDSYAEALTLRVAVFEHRASKEVSRMGGISVLGGAARELTCSLSLSLCVHELRKDHGRTQ